jgi:hypothetical protein
LAQAAAKVSPAGVALPGSAGASDEGGTCGGTSERRGWRGWGAKAAFAAGGLLVGGVLIGSLTASAADTAKEDGWSDAMSTAAPGYLARAAARTLVAVSPLSRCPSGRWLLDSSTLPLWPGPP